MRFLRIRVGGCGAKLFVSFKPNRAGNDCRRRSKYIF
jgi:hypothetical protein